MIPGRRGPPAFECVRSRNRTFKRTSSWYESSVMPGIARHSVYHAPDTQADKPRLEPLDRIHSTYAHLHVAGAL
jgi:hypothetical protein